VIRKTKAFTLIEILTVLVIVSGLTIFSAVVFPKQIVKARDSVRKSNIRRVVSAIEEIYQDTGCYPISIPFCTNSLTNGSLTILDKIPCDPETKNSYVYVPETSSCPKWFQLYGILENTSDSIIDRVGCRNGCGPQCQFNFGISSTNQTLDPYCKEVISTTNPIATPGPSPTPFELEQPNQYACSPSGSCEIYVNPEISGCPNIYINDPTCQEKCLDRIFRCHDARGKIN